MAFMDYLGVNPPLFNRTVTVTNTPGAGATSTTLNIAFPAAYVNQVFLTGFSVLRAAGTISSVQVNVEGAAASGGAWQLKTADTFIDLGNLATPIFYPVSITVTHSATGAAQLTLIANLLGS